MHWLWKLQGLCLRWGTWMPHRMVHIRTRHLAPLQWGHQEVPAKFNFASDVLDHWADMEKVWAGEEAQNWERWLRSLIHPFVL